MADRNNPRSRMWFITDMNPPDKDEFISILMELSPRYYCFAYENAPTTGRMHAHCLMYFDNARAFKALKAKLPTGNLQIVRGTVGDCIDYIRKGEQDGSNCDFYEHGTPPSNRGNAANTPKSFQIMAAIRSGASDLEIIETIPGAAYQARTLDLLRQTLIKEHFENEFRAVEVFYLSGPTAVGKTRYVYAQADKPSMIYRLTSYKRGLLFDGYSANDIICLDEFSSAHVPIRELLSLADGYPLMLPARYADKVAAHTKLYLVSNLSLREQYKYEQIHEQEVWNALLRRMTGILEMQSDGRIVDKSTDYKIKGGNHHEQ